jgi:hypothetical protein
MAIAFDANSQAQGGNPSSSFSWSHTCTGSNLMLVVSVMSNTAADPTGITYNGVAMTKGKTGTDANRNCSIWYLANPATGANTVAVTWAGSTAYPAGSATSYTGCDTTIGANTASNTATSGTTFSVALTTTVSNSFVCVSGVDNNGTLVSASSGSNVRNTQSVPDGTGLGQFMFDQSFAVVQSNTTQVTIVSNQGFWILAALEILPAGGGGGATLPYRAMMGVGK